MKRLIATALCFILAFTLCYPVYAQADSFTLASTGATYDTLAEAVGAAAPTDTITLTSTHTDTTPVEIDGKNIILNLGVNSLTLDIGGAYISALRVVNGGSLECSDGTLIIVASGTASEGISISGTGSKVEITGSVTVSGENSHGIEAFDGGEVILTGEISATGAQASGVFARDIDGNTYIGGIVTVNGNVKAETGEYGPAVYSSYGSSVTVNGNVTVNGTGKTGVRAYEKGTVNITGNINATGEYTYGIMAEYADSKVELDGSVSVKGDSSKAVYTSDNGTVNITGDVTAGDISGADEYCKCVQALYGGIASISGNVSATGESANGVHAYGSGEAAITGNVSATGDFAYGIHAYESGEVTVTGNISATGENAIGVLATDIYDESGEIEHSYSGAAITVNGDVRANGLLSLGIEASYNGTVTVNDGIVEAVGNYGMGIYSSFGGTVTVNEGEVNVEGDERKGVYAADKGTVHITGSISAIGDVCRGIEVTDEDSEVTLIGAGVTVDGMYSEAVIAAWKGSARITGDIIATGVNSTGVHTDYEGSSHISGNISATGDNCFGIDAYHEDSEVTVNGAVTAQGVENIAVGAQWDAEVSVTGNVTSIGTDGCGVYSEYGGTVAVTGDVSGNDGVWAFQISESTGAPSAINITGDVTATGIGAIGAHSDNGGLISVTGDVSATGAGNIYGLRLDSDINDEMHLGNIRVDGNVSARFTEGADGMLEGIGVYISRDENYAPETEEPVVAVTGNVESMLVINCGALVTIGGNITVLDWYGASVINGEAIIDGEINVDDPSEYVLVGGEPRYEASPDYIDVNGYWVYENQSAETGTFHIVRVRNQAPEEVIVTTDAADSITASSANLSGSVAYSGSGSITERGFEYSTASFTEAASIITIPAGSGVGSFAAEMPGLSANTTYYVRAYAVSSSEVPCYGDIISFTTLQEATDPPPQNDDPIYPPPQSGPSASVPTVVTNAVSDMTASGTTLSGSVTESGGADVTGRGFVCGRATNPAIGGTGVIRITAGSGMGGFTAVIDSLLPGTIYHVRAYATNSEGTSYGEDIYFITGKFEYLDASDADLSNPYGNVVLYTDSDGGTHILGLGIIMGTEMKYVPRGPGNYEIIYNAKPFEDIEGHWAKNEIDFASARLLFQGVTPRLFAPDATMTRGMFAAVLGRMYGADPTLYAGRSFDDVPVDAYYAPYVKWAAENGIILGVSESAFEPERAVTRQEMAAMMHRFMKHLGLEFGEEQSIPFDDGEQIGGWAMESVMTLRDTGILSGKPNNQFEPKASSTRAQVATVLKRLIEYILQ